MSDLDADSSFVAGSLSDPHPLTVPKAARGTLSKIQSSVTSPLLRTPNMAPLSEKASPSHTYRPAYGACLHARWAPTSGPLHSSRLPPCPHGPSSKDLPSLPTHGPTDRDVHAPHPLSPGAMRGPARCRTPQPRTRGRPNRHPVDMGLAFRTFQNTGSLSLF